MAASPRVNGQFVAPAAKSRVGAQIAGGAEREHGAEARVTRGRAGDLQATDKTTHRDCPSLSLGAARPHAVVSFVGHLKAERRMGRDFLAHA